MPTLNKPFILTPHLPSSSAPRPPRPVDSQRLHRIFGQKPALRPPQPWLRQPPPSLALELRGRPVTIAPVTTANIHEPVIGNFLENLEFPCGLRPSEIFSLMLRDLTPEDYDTLLKLDERNTKKTAAEVAATIVAESAVAKDTCGICLDETTNSLVKRLSCGHVFHAECIDRWLGNYADRCPIDNQPLTIQM